MSEASTTTQIKRYAKLARAVQARDNCVKSGNAEWESRWNETINEIMDSAPSGSGIDSGTKLISSTNGRLVFGADFHHMDEFGGYDGWTEHTIVVTPSLQFGITLKVTGRNRNNIREYLGDVFDYWLNESIDAY